MFFASVAATSLMATLVSSLVPGQTITFRPTLKSTSYAYRSVPDNIQILKVNEQKGLGAFATEKIKLGTYIGRIEGELVTLREARCRYWNKGELLPKDEEWIQSRKDRNQGITGNYLFEIGDGSVMIDCEDGDCSGWCRFMNHEYEGEEECNVKAFKQQTNGGKEHDPWFYAIRDIDIGEELCYDYGGTFYN